VNLALASVGLGVLVAAAGCGARPSGNAAAASEPSRGGADWSRFDGSHEAVDPKNARLVPESPIEITGVPYVRAVRLSWSSAAEVPSFEPENQTLKLPADTRQAVVAVAVVALPDASDIRVEWFYGDDRVFADAIQSRDDGDHYFALVKREGKKLAALPKGQYRAEVLDGAKVIKTIRFEVGAAS
jgi:hypothetical protein